ncbi:MAG TPA: hypothetical protein VJY35_00835 [Candidatus Eisenbacteria bacterium]|nr:hypothetical protein [Candidatus Eisenbacteria bacterium]
MRSKIAACVGVVVALSFASASWAGLGDDVFSSTNGNLFAARLTQSEDELKVPEAEQVFNIASWNGKTLGTQWVLQCGVQYMPADVKGALDSKGNGVLMTTTVFEGGKFILYQEGPWGTTWGTLNGAIGTNKVVLTETYENMKLVKAEMIAVASGITKLGRVVRFEFNRCLAWGEVDEPKFGYPAFLDGNCSATRNHGYWGDMGDVKVTISRRVIPVMGAESTEGSDGAALSPAATWGAMKIRYR